MKRLLIALLMFGTAYAGEVNLTWNASEGAEGYRVYAGTSNPPSTDAHEVEVVGTTTPLTTLQDGCVQQYIAVTAFNIAGESELSDVLPVYPRPVFLGPPELEERPSGNVIALNGGNYAPGVTLTVNNVAVPFLVADCENIDVPVLTLPGGLIGQPMTFQLCNGPVCQSVAIPVVDKVTGLAAN